MTLTTLTTLIALITLTTLIALITLTTLIALITLTTLIAQIRSYLVSRARSGQRHALQCHEYLQWHDISIYSVMISVFTVS
jgi:hypothetical protein